MHIVYLGIVSRPEDIGKIGEASVAGNKMQYNLLKYLSRINGVTIDIVSFHPYKPFSRSKKLIVRQAKEELFPGVSLYQVGYLNIGMIKQLILPLQTKRMAKRLLQDKNDILMSFDMYPTQGIPMSKLRKKVNGQTVCLLADLSIGGVQKQKGFKKILRKLYDKSTLKNIKKCNYFITLNECAMKTYAPHSKYIVIDGGIEPTEFENVQACWNGEAKNILYTGALVEYSGIMTLIRAMDSVQNPDIVLDIYGNGNLKDEIVRICRENPKIRYHGSVSNSEAMKAQQSAWLLANPRPTENAIAKVTFPSKIFEYMMSGRPVLSTRLNGFSADYEDLLFWVNDASSDALAAKINEIDQINNSDLLLKAQRTKNYLLKNKTWEINADKIYRFFRESFE